MPVLVADSSHASSFACDVTFFCRQKIFPLRHVPSATHLVSTSWPRNGNKLCVVKPAGSVGVKPALCHSYLWFVTLLSGSEGEWKVSEQYLLEVQLMKTLLWFMIWLLWRFIYYNTRFCWDRVWKGNTGFLLWQFQSSVVTDVNTTSLLHTTCFCVFCAPWRHIGS